MPQISHSQLDSTQDYTYFIDVILLVFTFNEEGYRIGKQYLPLSGIGLNEHRQWFMQIKETSNVHYKLEVGLILQQASKVRWCLLELSSYDALLFKGCLPASQLVTAAAAAVVAAAAAAVFRIPRTRFCTNSQRSFEWMDGWLVGWLVGWMDGWIVGWIDGTLIVELTDKRWSNLDMVLLKVRFDYYALL
ncbi:hypothetical protein M0802_005806 [Mischocyttarus mexicanus]|nr:hypothetical protein M0802_005806 [Mischocyttarus mexicanus]